MYFFSFVVRKTWLDKCLKTTVSEDPLTSNMVNGSNHFSKLNDSNFTIFIEPAEGSLG